MEKFTTLEGVAAPLRMINVDTDMVIPKQYLKTIKRTGLGKGLFSEQRYKDDGSENPDFVPNNPAYRQAKRQVPGDTVGRGARTAQRGAARHPVGYRAPSNGRTVEEGRRAHGGLDGQLHPPCFQQVHRVLPALVNCEKVPPVPHPSDASLAFAPSEGPWTQVELTKLPPLPPTLEPLTAPGPPLRVGQPQRPPPEGQRLASSPGCPASPAPGAGWRPPRGVTVTARPGSRGQGRAAPHGPSTRRSPTRRP